MPEDAGQGPRLPRLDDDELARRGFSRRSPDLVRRFAHAPQVFKRWNTWYWAIIADGAVDSRLKEMVRLRVAQLNHCEF